MTPENAVKYEAVIDYFPRRLRHWNVDIRESRWFQGRWCMTPLVSERCGWDCWSKNGALKKAERLLRRRERVAHSDVVISENRIMLLPARRQMLREFDAAVRLVAPQDGENA